MLNTPYCENFIKIRLFFVAFLFFFLSFSQEYGLSFKGHEYSLDDRTELNITPEDYLELNNHFQLSFDIKVNIQADKPLFGYVLRIINKTGENIDLMFTNYPNKGILNLITGNSQSVIPIQDFNLKNNKWVNININFLLSEGFIQIRVGNEDLIKEPIHFKAKDKFKILFGANSLNEVVTSDVPDMNIRDIKLYHKNKLKYHFPLKQCDGTVTKDIVSKASAVIKNPKWLLCKHQEWYLELSSENKGVSLVIANEKQSELLILTNSHLLTYNVKSKSLKKLPYKGGDISLSIDHRAIFNENENNIYCYLLDRETYSTLNLETGEWNNRILFNGIEHNQNFQNHNGVFNPQENVIYTLGGYGHYKYNNIVNRIDLNDGKWSRPSINDSIFKPRYLAGSAILNDSIYILGGYGNNSGDQLINPKSYFNLLAYNVKTNTFKEKFAITKYLSDMIVANNMWINPKDRNYYALISDKVKFNSYLKLLQGNLDSQEAQILGDSIPYKFLDIKSFASLFYFPNENKLVAYSSYINDKNITEYSINSIQYPPIAIVKFKDKASQASKSWMLYTFFGILFLITVFAFYYKKRLKKKQALSVTGVSLEEKVSFKNVNDTEDFEDLDFNLDLKKRYYRLIFFGGFQAINKEDIDITGKFSPLLKELFLLIWLFTFKDNKGISSEKIIEYLWYDKSQKRAQNNRAVNIAKLKGLIDEIGGCVITNETGYWKIKYNQKELHSDYFDLLKITEEKKDLNEKRIDRLLKITEKGPFLLNLDYEWLDYFKAQVSERGIDTLTTYLEEVNIQKDPEFVIRLTDCIFNFDSINEEAMIYKCKAQNIMGKHSLAESTFKKFIKEFKILYGEDYQQSFTDILK